MKIIFSDTEFKYEHERAPKDYGRWGFSFEGYEFWVTGTLTEAKNACKKYVKQVAPEGYTETVTVNILP